MKQKQIFKAGLICIALLTSGMDMAWAKEKTSQKTIKMDSMVVSATREKTSAFDAPASVILVGEEELKRSQAATLKDAINYLPNVDFDNNTLGSIQRPSIRGLDQKQVIIKVDGVRQTFRGSSGIARNPAPIDASLLKEIEILRGPASALHGSGGMGGVITMKTKDASDFLKPGQTMGFSFRGGFQSATEEYSGTLAAYGRKGDIDLLAAGTYRDTGDFNSSSPYSGENKSERDGYSGSGLFKISTQLKADHKLGFSINTWQDKVETEKTLYKSNQQQFTGTWDWFKNNGLIDLKASVQYTRRNNEMENTARELDDDFNSIGFDIYNIFSGQFSPKTYWKLTIGTDGAFDHQEGTDFGKPDSSRPDADARDLGAFSRFDLSFSDKFSITPALRYTYYSRKASNTTADDQSDSKWSPRITAKLTPLSWLNFFCTYSETYRAPIMDEIYFELEYPMPPGMPGIKVVPNPDLKPETAKTFEGGFGFKLDDIAAKSDKFRFKAVVFTEKVYDFITPSTTPTITPSGDMEYTSINVGKVSRYGVELELDYITGPFSINAAYGMVKGEDKNSDEKTGSVPQNLVISLGWNLPVETVSIYWRSKFVDDTDYVLYRNLKEVPGYALHGAGLVWTPNVSWAKNLRCDFGVDNIFNKEYVNYRGGVDKAINIKAAVSLSF